MEKHLRRLARRAKRQGHWAVVNVVNIDMQSETIRRVLVASLKGALLFCIFAEGIFAFWPWFFALPQVTLWYLWPLVGSYPVYLLVSGVIGLIFGALIGLPRRWWWSLAIGGGFGFLSLFAFGLHFSVANILFAGVIILALCGLSGMVRAAIQLPIQIESARKTYRILAEVTTIGVLIGAGLLLSRLVAEPEDSVEILSIYEVAQTNGWHIQSIRFGGLVAESGYDVRIRLMDGSTKDCAYWVAVGDEYAYSDPNGFRNASNVKDAISCPP